ncbi:hypothetical protein EMIHUDRAFT_203861 [Emiliania huxleyi CCMP1516]|uniref:Uncharacterized protein n=2 Tax=Emiliania huxleyi TaxID=2903 RepID=A0A0D3K0I8_EMIH1|nr:hypothetical protein EMIHUDRAFT_203861 [Emiliania huxleyi CCMP1516]EOD29273.1 hypothetical protein EMIHUDRAFT_203861 [Emiliania huxleyi CCMP1516]|eukprot:XP_005781702.1 hypothetical protein EMIHUDRAFT_203861 [Emiliania huxleyi CCMP1516]
MLLAAPPALLQHSLAPRLSLSSPPLRIRDAPLMRTWQDAVSSAQDRAATVKAEQDAVAAVMLTGTAGCLFVPGVLLLPIDNLALDLLASSLVGGLLGVAAGFGDGAVGAALRSVGGWVVDALPLDKLPSVSYADVKKYGVAGTIAYILTELAFWAVAFPVASTSFYNLNGHWPDFGDGADRAAVLAFIFAGANVARLVVPLRFGAAFALAPWVEENVCQRFGIGGGREGA